MPVCQYILSLDDVYRLHTKHLHGEGMIRQHVAACFQEPRDASHLCMICLPHVGVYLCGACFGSKSASLLLCSGTICILSVVHLDLVPFSLFVTSAATGPVLQDKLAGCHDRLFNAQAARERKNHVHVQLSSVNNGMTLPCTGALSC